MTRKSISQSSWTAEIEEVVRQRINTAFALPEGELSNFRRSLAQATVREISEAEFREVCIEALVWMIVHAINHPTETLDATFNRAGVFSRFAGELLAVLNSDPTTPPPIRSLRSSPDEMASEPLLQYESHLAASDPSTRMRRGVFYTPRVIARHIVKRIDTTLRQRFELPDGLADTTTWREMLGRHPEWQLPPGTDGDESFVRILDPAAGTGVFLVEVIERIHSTMQNRWRNEGSSDKEILVRWNAYVSEHLLPRLFAIELMPTPSVISQISIAQLLAETGYTFHSSQPFRFTIADALLDPTSMAKFENNNAMLRDTLSRAAFTVVLGNPPFRGISSNASSWIGKLLRGVAPGGQPVASYYEVDGEPLGERKLWLQDDYVKFMRFAQWQIERTGVGIVGFVTNHGYLDNTTFRGMRHAMLETFEQIDVFDLHGNRKKNKFTPNGGVDKGMFEIEQGVAIGIFSRNGLDGERQVTHREVWGSRDVKVTAIVDAARVPVTRIDPRSPHYLFVPDDSQYHSEYEAGFPLNEVMPVNSTAVVTARDSFVVAFDKTSLAKRMEAFCDKSVSDTEIRSRFFTNSRSTKYPPGDTRGWKLADARQRMMQETDRSKYYRSCLYRPFDRRMIFWADWMIDWPRLDVTEHMLARPNLAIVARRQMPPSGPCGFFWITDTIALDGLIRSDNRGSESIFPLWLDANAGSREVNLSPQFVAAIEDRLGLFWNIDGESTGDNGVTPIDVLHYIYALFSTVTYRVRYSESLRRDFPRILLPNCLNVWKTFCEVGSKISKLHLLDANATEEPTGESEAAVSLGTGYPKFVAGEIWLRKGGPNIQASERVWDYQVGAHQVCRKWLRDRKAFDTRTVRQYEQIVDSIAKTLDLTDHLEASVTEAGGWEAVFSA